MTMIDPFTAAREQAVSDLQGMMDGTGNAPGTPVGTETKGNAPTIPPFSLDEEEGNVEASVTAVGEEAAASDDPSPASTTPSTSVEVPTPKPTPEGEPKSWTLKHRGKEVVVSDENEVRELAQMGYDYRFKTAELQKEKAEFHSQWERKETALKQFLRNKDMVRAYLNDLEQMESGDPSGDEPLTVAQAQHLVETRVNAALQKEREDRARQTYTAQVAQLTTQYRTDVDSAISTAVTSHPILGEAVEGIEVLLLADIAPRVSAMIMADPETPVDMGEVKALIAAAAARRAQRLDALTVNVKKQTAVDAARLRKNSPAPSGGVAPSQRPARPQQFKMGSKELVNAAIADLQRGGAPI